MRMCGWRSGLESDTVGQYDHHFAESDTPTLMIPDYHSRDTQKSQIQGVR
jgi:hypothetical protein